VTVLATGCASTVKSAANGAASAAASAASSLASQATGTDSPSSTSPATPTSPDTPTSPATPTSPSVTVTATATPSGTTVTVTATASPSASVTPSASASPAESPARKLLWLWIVLAVVVLGGLIALIVHAGRRRSTAAAGWRSRLIDAYSRGAALHDAMSAAEAPGALAGAGAGARWADIQRRADDLAQVLYAIHESADSEADRERAADTLAALHAARSAMEAERAAGGADAYQAEIVRGRLGAFEASLQALRAGDDGFG
jgi:hypothetical protein